MHKAIFLNDYTFWVGAFAPEETLADTLFESDAGVSYNSYLVMGSQKSALINTVKEEYSDEFLERLDTVPGFKTIDYIICQTVSLTHTGAINKVLERFPNARPVVPRWTSAVLQNIINDEAVRPLVVKDKDIIDLGDVSLEFFTAPGFNFSESLICVPEDKSVLFSGQLFSAHLSNPSLFDDKFEMEDTYRKAYFNRYWLKHKKRCKELCDIFLQHKPVLIAPLYGPVLRKNPARVINEYRRLCTNAGKTANGKIGVLFFGLFSNMKSILSIIGDKLEKNGLEPVFIDASNDDRLADLSMLADSSALLIGVDTSHKFASAYIWRALFSIPDISVSKKPMFFFGIYGEREDEIVNINKQLNAMNFNIKLPPLKVRMLPSVEEELRTENFTQKILDTLKGK